MLTAGRTAASGIICSHLLRKRPRTAIKWCSLKRRKLHTPAIDPPKATTCITWLKQRAEQIQPDTPGKNTEGSWNWDGEAFSIQAKGTTMTSSAPCLTARGRRKNTEKGGTKRV